MTSVADFFDRQVDARRRPERFARAWVHTHPGASPMPSPTDEETFARVFGRSDWAVMFILAAGGQTYSRLSFHVGPGGSLELPVSVDYSRPFGAATTTPGHGNTMPMSGSNVPPFGLDRVTSWNRSARETFEPAPEDDWFDDWYAAVDHEPQQPDYGGLRYA